MELGDKFVWRVWFVIFVRETIGYRGRRKSDKGGNRYRTMLNQRNLFLPSLGGTISGGNNESDSWERYSKLCEPEDPLHNCLCFYVLSVSCPSVCLSVCQSESLKSEARCFHFVANPSVDTSKQFLLSGVGGIRFVWKSSAESPTRHKCDNFGA